MNLTETSDVLAEVLEERRAQQDKWGQQDHPDLSPNDPGLRYRSARATYAKERCEEHKRAGALHWYVILKEEIAEVVEQAAAGNKEELREELIQCAAVIVAWIEALDRRR